MQMLSHSSSSDAQSAECEPPSCFASDLRRVSDEDLLRFTGEMTRRSRRTEADLVAHLGEVDARRLYLREACSSMFAYCTERLHFSEAEAWLRISAARASRQHPTVLAMLADGRLHLSAVACLAPHLTATNRDAVLSRAVHRSKREILEVVAELSPKPDVASGIRKLPARDLVCRTLPETLQARPDRAEAAGDGGAPLQPRPDTVDRSESPDWPLARAAQRPGATHAATIVPLAPARYKVQFTAGTQLRDKLERLRALMRSSVPDGDLATIIEEAVTEKLARLESRRFSCSERPTKSLAETDTRPSSRHIPAAVRRAVAERDGDRCAYRDALGRRCTAGERLEFHHRRPYGHGGGHSVDNVALLCPAHNRFLAEVDYGRGAGARRRSAETGTARIDMPKRATVVSSP